jgi:DNA-binding PadR family transcriptional regulator
MSLEYMILGILKDEPLSGYDLNKRFGLVPSFFWSADQAQIYRTLYRMRELGWVKQEEKKQLKNPDKKLYHLTAKGREELEGWLRQAPSLGVNRMAWLGQLFFAKQLSHQEYIGLLEDMRQQWQASLEVLEARFMNADLYRAARTQQQETQALPTGVITLHYGIQRLRFQVGWAEEAIALLRKLEEPTKKR